MDFPGVAFGWRRNSFHNGRMAGAAGDSYPGTQTGCIRGRTSPVLSPVRFAEVGVTNSFREPHRPMFHSARRNSYR